MVGNVHLCGFFVVGFLLFMLDSRFHGLVPYAGAAVAAPTSVVGQKGMWKKAGQFSADRERRRGTWKGNEFYSE